MNMSNDLWAWQKDFDGYREDWPIEKERDFVSRCFSSYEAEGFAKQFWSQGGDFARYHGESFEVIGRATEDDADLCVLPMWKIKFQDGDELCVYPDEIIPREMKDNGCPYSLDALKAQR